MNISYVVVDFWIQRAAQYINKIHFRMVSNKHKRIVGKDNALKRNKFMNKITNIYVDMMVRNYSRKEKYYKMLDVIFSP